MSSERSVGPPYVAEPRAERERLLDEREKAVAFRERRADERQRLADQRDEAAERRERLADGREAAADLRERRAEELERTADRHQGALDAQEQQVDRRSHTAQQTAAGCWKSSSAALARAREAIAESRDRIKRHAASAQTRQQRVIDREATLSARRSDAEHVPAHQQREGGPKPH
ncbi:hypothetical protein [Streptomyces rimosus]|uniref:hypothetical protein n=1 Tax=Streptomyces rimosus TaxID=1927 RepID=UPI0037D3BCAD